jgi:beta-galactosidase
MRFRILGIGSRGDLRRTDNAETGITCTGNSVTDGLEAVVGDNPCSHARSRIRAFHHRSATLAIWIAGILFMAPGISLAGTYTPPSTVRESALLSDGWKFLGSTSVVSGASSTTFNDASWQSVSIPHTWNGKSASQETQFANAWYRTYFNIPASDSGKRIYLDFEGVATLAQVYVNGVLVGSHKGAYTRFRVDATAQIVFGGQNTLAVKVDNTSANTADCLPAGDQNMLYNIYGGIYRKVWLEKTAPQAVDPMFFSSPGLFAVPVSVSASAAKLTIQTHLRNSGSSAQSFSVRNVVVDPSGTVVSDVGTTTTVAANSTGIASTSVSIANPRLWGPGNPALHTVYAEISVGGTVTDVVQVSTGFRTASLTGSTFTMNGKSLPLRGVSKHQENTHHETAVTDDDLIAEWDTIASLGANFVRLPHYPHAKLEYDLADQDGIVVWAENGYSNQAVHSTAGDTITMEMVYQNFNHPSIVFWSAGNEATIAMGSVYAGIIRSIDPSRIVAYADDHGVLSEANIDAVFQNKYPGWYDGLTWDFPTFIQTYHWISETGAGGVVSNHQSYTSLNFTRNQFEPEEFMQYIHESRVQTVFVNSPGIIPAFLFWNEREFGVWGQDYKNINSKGMTTRQGLRKDVWFLFQTFLRPSFPVVHICGKNWYLRQSVADVKVYSNQPAVTLTVNGVSKGAKTNGAYTQTTGQTIRNTFFWTGALQAGKNVVVASDGSGHVDSSVVYYHGSGAVPATGGALAGSVTSSNPANPATFIDIPLQAFWPIYDNVDGSGDNTFDTIPQALTQSRWISTSRMSVAGNKTDLTFTVADSAKVYVMFTKGSSTPGFVATAGLSNTGITGVWLDNNLELANYSVYGKTVKGGTTVTIPGSTLDYVVLVQPNHATTGIVRSAAEGIPSARVRGEVLEYNLAHTSDVAVRVSDLMGREHFSHLDVEAPAGMRFLTLPRESLPQGLYVVDISSGTAHQRLTYLSSGR